MSVRGRIRLPPRSAVFVAGVGPFAMLGVALALWTDGKALAAHDAALLSLGLGVAVFAVNFSFLAFQMSPYRSLVRGIPSRQLLAALGLIALALVPLAGFVCGDRLVGQLAVEVPGRRRHSCRLGSRRGLGRH